MSLQVSGHTESPNAPRGAWFSPARLGLFIHWGAYSRYGRGEQVLFREHLDQSAYAASACAWNPRFFDARRWAATAQAGGFRYAVLTTRHHDGFCLWDSQVTDYTTARQAPGRDFVKEYVEAFREAGLRVGLYYSLADWRIPAYFEGSGKDPAGWAAFRTYVHAQVRELCTRYGPIDLLWFDGAWPRTASEWGSAELVEMIRQLQPGCLVNNRLGDDAGSNVPGSPATPEQAAGASALHGDFGTPEHHITAELRPWESCQVSTWRLWGYTAGERWRPADLLLDLLIEASAKGGNLLLNVGPDAQGRFPPEFEERAAALGQWLDVHGECVYGPGSPGDVTEFVTMGRQIVKGNNLYLVMRFWDGAGELRLADLATRVRRATLLTTGQDLAFRQSEAELVVRGLPRERPTALFPVIRLECDGPPTSTPWGLERLWAGDPDVFAPWARQRGTSVWADGQQRQPERGRG